MKPPIGQRKQVEDVEHVEHVEQAGLIRLLGVTLHRLLWNLVDAVWIATRPPRSDTRRLAAIPTDDAYPAWDPTTPATRDVVARHGATEGDVVYGEMFLWPTARFLRSLFRSVLTPAVGARPVVVDLGCGRGRVLAAARAVGAAARGVEIWPGHLAALRHLQGLGPLEDTVILDVDAAVAPIADADLVWLSWATWRAESRAAVTASLIASLRPGALVCAVVHEVPGAAFEVVSRHRLPASWGYAEVSVQRRT